VNLVIKEVVTRLLSQPFFVYKNKSCSGGYEVYFVFLHLIFFCQFGIRMFW